MAEKLDVIIFGATGYSAKVVVKDSIDFLANYKWGVAGRNHMKLKSLLEEIGEAAGVSLSHIPIIIADATDEKSIQAMAKQCKMVINCCGPYRFYGEVVVKACVEAGTHHVDFSGESQYFNKMYLKYHDLAQQNNVYVVSTCGFDSLPAELGVVFAERNFDGTINSVESYWENSADEQEKVSNAVLNYGTWDSLINAIADLRGMLKLEKAVIPKNLPSLQPKLDMKLLFHRIGFSDNYFLPFPGIDRGVVRRTQYHLFENEGRRPIQFEVYLGFRSLLIALCFPFMMALLCVLANIPFTKKLLLNYPEVVSFGRISRSGPPQENVKASKFRMTFIAKGWNQGQSLSDQPNKQKRVRVSARNGYAVTSIGILSAAKMILEESNKMPGRGGVLTPGAAFRNTSIIEVFQKHGIKFEVLD